MMGFWSASATSAPGQNSDSGIVACASFSLASIRAAVSGILQALLAVKGRHHGFYRRSC